MKAVKVQVYDGHLITFEGGDLYVHIDDLGCLYVKQDVKPTRTVRVYAPGYWSWAATRMGDDEDGVTITVAPTD